MHLNDDYNKHKYRRIHMSQIINLFAKMGPNKWIKKCCWLELSCNVKKNQSYTFSQMEG